MLPYQLIVLFLLALLPRITGLITFTNPDENWGASARVLAGELSGGTSQTLPLVNYLNAASFVVLYAIGRIVGVWHTTAEFRAQYFVDKTPFMFAGRFVSACLGALSAPLAALIASRLGLNRRSSLIVGGMVAILPANVWLSHVAKPDSGVAFAVLLFTWALLRKLDCPESKWSDVMVGAALAIAMSFKQTALFVVAPALVGLLALLRWDCKLPWSQIARGLAVALLTSAVASVPMNIGVLLDLPGFLDYQRATVVVMSSKGTAYEVAKYVIPMIAGTIGGMTAAGVLVWLFAPCVRHDRKFLFLWGSAAFAFVAFTAISGGMKTAARYFLPFNELAFTLACIAALSLANRQRSLGWIGGLLTLVILAFELAGSAEVVRQAMATPMPPRCAEVIKAIAQPDRDRILVADPYFVGVPIDATASDEEYHRHERLAKKYGVKLGERAEEKKSHRHQSGPGYYVRQIPFAFGGMENLESTVAQTAIKPYWWPIQEEEWNLDYWTAQGFNIFLVLDEAGPGITSVPAYRSLYAQIKQRCEQVAFLRSLRRLFNEGEVTIYQLRDRGRPKQTTGTNSSKIGNHGPVAESALSSSPRT
jgi:hypothetical protein